MMDMDAELAVIEERQPKARALKHGRLEEFLTGRVRLVDSGELIVESEAGKRK